MSAGKRANSATGHRGAPAHLLDGGHAALLKGLAGVPADYDAEAVTARLGELREEIRATALHNILVRMPAKVISLTAALAEKAALRDRLLVAPKRADAALYPHHLLFMGPPPAEEGAAVVGRVEEAENGAAPLACNGKRPRPENDAITFPVAVSAQEGEDAVAAGIAHLYELIQREYEALKREILELVDICNAIKTWIQLNIPKTEEGNNFNVAIQEETINELTRAEDSGLNVMDTFGKFFIGRAELLGKANKYGGGGGARGGECWAAFWRAIAEVDEKQVYSVWIGWLDLRNNYATMHDSLMKNLEKLLNPRTSNHASMY